MSEHKLEYDNEASGPFTEGEVLTFGGGGTARLEILRDAGATGSMYVAMISGSVPADNETITGGTSSATADVNGTPFASRFPLKIREDISFDNATSNIRWTGGNLGGTHSCEYDNEASGPFTVGEILTFGNGSTAELIELVDAGLTGEIFFRMIDVDLPADNDTITGGTSSATADVNGAVFTRAYRPNEIHYWFSDLADDANFVGNDEQDRTQPRISVRSGVTDIQLLGSANIDDDMSYRIYGGSILQGASQTAYRGVTIAVVDVDGLTEPVIIQDGALLSATTTEYWKNAYMPDAASRINMVIKTENAGTEIDRSVVRFRALENLRQYFTAPDPTLGAGVTPVSLVATDDGNNTTAPATVATWTDAVLAYGFDTVDHNNGNGAQPYWAVGDLGTRTKPQFHERQKWVQRRGTAETILGHNAQLIVGVDLTIQYDNEALGPFTEGEILNFGGGGSAYLLGLDDQGVTGTLYCQRRTGDVPADNETITGATSSATADINGTPTTRLIINNLVGTFTGAAFNPTNAGVTLEAADASAADLFVDLLAANQQPPDNQSGTVNTDAANAILVGPWDGVSVDGAGDAEPDWDFHSLSTTLSGAAETAVVVASIPSWVPSGGGFLRVTTDAGRRLLVPYTSHDGSTTYTIPSTDFTGDNATSGNDVMPAPLDGVGVSSFSGVFSSPQQMVVRVTNGSDATPKQPSVNTVTFGAGGFDLNVSLQDD